MLPSLHACPLCFKVNMFVEADLQMSVFLCLCVYVCKYVFGCYHVCMEVDVYICVCVCMLCVCACGLVGERAELVWVRVHVFTITSFEPRVVTLAFSSLSSS